METLKTKFTRGPWTLVNPREVWTGDDQMKDNDGYIIATCHGHSEAKHNAQLIAAAPTMFEFINRWFHTIQNVPEYFDPKEFEKEAAEIIAKATGKDNQ